MFDDMTTAMKEDNMFCGEMDANSDKRKKNYFVGYTVFGIYHK